MLSCLIVDSSSRSGKGLGGSSGINFMCWTKPPTQDVDGAFRLSESGNRLTVLGRFRAPWESQLELEQLREVCCSHGRVRQNEVRDQLCEADRTFDSFVEPSEEVQKKYKMNFEAWKIGRQGDLETSSAYTCTLILFF